VKRLEIERGSLKSILGVFDAVKSTQERQYRSSLLIHTLTEVKSNAK